jgi:hypothetical protein
LAVAAAVGALVVVLTWFAGTGLFAISHHQEGTVVTAVVTLPVPCTAPSAQETVSFPFGGTTRDGILNACGQNHGERIDVVVPANAGAGMIQVNTAQTVPGNTDLRRPVGLALVAMSCFAGAFYVYLVRRGARRLAPA